MKEVKEGAKEKVKWGRNDKEGSRGKKKKKREVETKIKEK